jgi:hypothetical protein
MHRRLLPLIEVLALAILLMKGEGKTLGALSLANHKEAEKVYLILTNPQNVLLFKLLSLEDDLVLSQAFGEVRQHAPASRPYWSGGARAESAPARLVEGYEKALGALLAGEFDGITQNPQMWAPIVEYAKRHDLWDNKFYASLVKHTENRVLDWKERFAYTETVSHSVHALFGPDIDEGPEREAVVQTEVQALYTKLGETCRVTHFNQLVGIGRKKLVEQLRIRRHGDGNKEVSCGSTLSTARLLDLVKDVILKENPDAETAGPSIQVVRAHTLMKDLVVNEWLKEHPRLLGVEPVQETDKASFVQRIESRLMRRPHPNKVRIAKWLLSETADPNSIQGLNSTATFLLRHETEDGAQNPHRLALHEFSQGTAPLCHWWDTYQALVCMGAKHLPGDAEECEGVFSGVTSQVGAKQYHMTAHSVSADLRSRRNPKFLQASLRKWDDMDEVDRRWAEAGKLLKVLECQDFWGYNVGAATQNKALMSKRWNEVTHQLVDTANARSRFVVSEVHTSTEGELLTFELKAKKYEKHGAKTLAEWSKILNSNGPLQEVKHMSVHAKMATMKDDPSAQCTHLLTCIEDFGDADAWCDAQDGGRGNEDDALGGDEQEEAAVEVAAAAQLEGAALAAEVAALAADAAANAADKEDRARYLAKGPAQLPHDVGNSGYVEYPNREDMAMARTFSSEEEEDLIPDSSSESESSSEEEADTDSEDDTASELVDSDQEEELHRRDHFDAWLREQGWWRKRNWLPVDYLTQNGIAVGTWVIQVVYIASTDEDYWLAKVLAMNNETVRMQWYPWNQQASTWVTKQTSKLPWAKRAVHAFVALGGSEYSQRRRHWPAIKKINVVEHSFGPQGQCFSVTQHQTHVLTTEVRTSSAAKSQPQPVADAAKRQRR